MIDDLLRLPKSGSVTFILLVPFLHHAKTKIQTKITLFFWLPNRLLALGDLFYRLKAGAYNLLAAMIKVGSNDN